MGPFDSTLVLAGIEDLLPLGCTIMSCHCPFDLNPLLGQWHDLLLPLRMTRLTFIALLLPFMWHGYRYPTVSVTLVPGISA